MGFPYTFPFYFADWRDQQMTINTTTLLAIEQLFSESIGDFLEFDTTTNITTNNSVISTTLTQYDQGDNGFFDNYWLYITEGNNITANRKTGLPGTTTYAKATGTLTVMGAALSAESGAVTCRLHKYDRNIKVNAIKRAVEHCYPDLYRTVEDMTLVTNNILPDGHFESWSSATTSKWYSVSSAALAQTSTAGLTRGGTYSMKVTASAAGGYAYLSSATYPRLLDLMGESVNMYVWASPDVADDASMQIYTVQADGTTQTLATSTANPARQFTLLKAENQQLNDNLVTVQIRFIVATNAKFVYFDNARVNGIPLTEYLLPDGFVGGDLNQVHIQTSGLADHPCDDLHSNNWTWIGHKVTSDGTNLYLGIDPFPKDYLLILRGVQPLETLSADTDTLTLDAHRLPLFLAYVKYIWADMQKTTISSKNIDRFMLFKAEAERDIYSLQRLAMPQMAIKPRERVRSR